MRRTDLTIQAAEEDYQLIVQKINDMLYRMVSIITDNVRIEKPPTGIWGDNLMSYNLVTTNIKDDLIPRLLKFNTNTIQARIVNMYYFANRPVGWDHEPQEPQNALNTAAMIYSLLSERVTPTQTPIPAFKQDIEREHPRLYLALRCVDAKYAVLTHEYITPDQIAALADITYTGAVKAIKEGRIPAEKVAGGWRIPRDQAYQYCEDKGI